MRGLLRWCGCDGRADGGVVLAVAGGGGEGGVAIVAGESAWLVGWGCVLL